MVDRGEISLRELSSWLCKLTPPARVEIGDVTIDAVAFETSLVFCDVREESLLIVVGGDERKDRDVSAVDIEDGKEGGTEDANGRET